MTESNDRPCVDSVSDKGASWTNMNLITYDYDASQLSTRSITLTTAYLVADDDNAPRARACSIRNSLEHYAVTFSSLWMRRLNMMRMDSHKTFNINIRLQ